MIAPRIPERVRINAIASHTLSDLISIFKQHLVAFPRQPLIILSHAHSVNGETENLANIFRPIHRRHERALAGPHGTTLPTDFFSGRKGIVAYLMRARKALIHGDLGLGAWIGISDFDARFGVTIRMRDGAPKRSASAHPLAAVDHDSHSPSQSPIAIPTPNPSSSSGIKKPPWLPPRQLQCTQ